MGPERFVFILLAFLCCSSSRFAGGLSSFWAFRSLAVVLEKWPGEANRGS
jgi:hypothetical protein